MSRLIQVGLLFISLMVGIQGQEPSSSPSSQSQLFCRIVLKRVVDEGSGSPFGKPKQTWYGWYTMTLVPELGLNCQELRKQLCDHVSGKFNCDKGWYYTSTETGDWIKKKFRGGNVCSQGSYGFKELVHDNQQHVLREGVNLIGGYLNQVAHQQGWEGDFRDQSGEIYCSSPKWKWPGWAVALFIIGILCLIAGALYSCHRYQKWREQKGKKATKRRRAQIAIRVKERVRNINLV